MKYISVKCFSFLLYFWMGYQQLSFENEEKILNLTKEPVSISHATWILPSSQLPFAMHILHYFGEFNPQLLHHYPINCLDSSSFDMEPNPCPSSSPFSQEFDEIDRSKLVLQPRQPSRGISVNWKFIQRPKSAQNFPR